MRLTHLAVVLLAACAAQPPTSGPGPGPNPPPSPTPDPGSLTTSDFITQLAGKECAQAFSCMAQYPSTGSDDTFADAYGTSQDDCVQSDDNVTSINAIEAAIASGTIDWDPDSAATCLGNLMFPSTCADFFSTWDYPDACYEALSGNVADGGACTTDWECSGDTSDCQAGKCAPDPSALTASKKTRGHRGSARS